MKHYEYVYKKRELFGVNFIKLFLAPQESQALPALVLVLSSLVC